MKKILVVSLTTLALFSSALCADGLKNSLTNIMHKKDTTAGMVDLSRLNVNGRAPVQQPKTRSSKAVVSTVNCSKNIKKDADAYSSKRTHEKLDNLDLLPT